MNNTSGDAPTGLKAAFISDLHLGSRDCRTEPLLRFLQRLDTESLYLVGDIVDFWSLRRSFYWPSSHAEVLRTLRALARCGTRVVFVPGNHDEDLREFCGTNFEGIEIRKEVIHQTAAGQRLLVAHGDAFDGAVRCGPVLAVVGSLAYDLTLRASRALERIRGRLGLGHWSLVTHLKSRIGRAARHIEAFERAAAHEAKRRGLDGIVCGHIHRAALRPIDGVLYCNDGDWVESCTALIEDQSGALRLWSANDPAVARKAESRFALPAAA